MSEFYYLIISVLWFGIVPLICGASSFALAQKKQKPKAPIGFLTLRGLEKPTTCKLAWWSAIRTKFTLTMIFVREEIARLKQYKLLTVFLNAHSTKADMAEIPQG